MFPTAKRSKRTPKVFSSISCQPSLSAKTIANNDDLLNQILVCLPIKSLLRFKCVSKHWLSIISNPDFSLQLNPKSQSIFGLFLLRNNLFNPALTKLDYKFISLGARCSHPPFRSLTFAEDPSDIRILQSCSGLLLCCCSCKYQPEPNYYVYNPATKQNTVLPPFTSSFTPILDVCLAYDPSKSPHYKVICFRASNTSTDQFQIEIYSSRTGPWRASAPPFTLPFHIQLKNAVFWNGAIHWIGDWSDSLSFDVDEERIRVMPMPSIPDGWDERRIRYIGESRGHLHLIEIYGSCTIQFCVYEMVRDYSGWFPKYQVDLSSVVAAYPEMRLKRLDPVDLHYYSFSILCVVEEADDEKSYLVLHLPNKVIRYNFKDMSFKNLHDLCPSQSSESDDQNSFNFGCFGVFQFVPTLACV